MTSDVAQALLAGDRRALSRALTWVENATPEGESLLRELFPHTGQAHLIGVTGPPGVGKSTLVNHLARYYRRKAPSPRKVAIVAVDPSSPFTGGALLGDRVRMRDLAGDPGVFIRSMASRGAVGGLARRTAAVVQVLDAAGYERIFIETVGTGQSEVEIARLAHTVIVVQAPGLGDDIQALKAGILEIADILVVNKADLPDARRLAHILAEWVRREVPPNRDGSTLPDTRTSSWTPPVLLTIASQGEGISEVATALEEHRAFLRDTSMWRERERRRFETELRERLLETLWASWKARASRAQMEAVLSAVLQRTLSPQEAAEALLEPWLTEADPS